MVRRSAAHLALLLLVSAVPAAAAEEPRAFLRFAERLSGPPTVPLVPRNSGALDGHRLALVDDSQAPAF